MLETRTLYFPSRGAVRGSDFGKRFCETRPVIVNNSSAQHALKNVANPQIYEIQFLPINMPSVESNALAKQVKLKGKLAQPTPEARSGSSLVDAEEIFRWFQYLKQGIWLSSGNK